MTDKSWDQAQLSAFLLLFFYLSIQSALMRLKKALSEKVIIEGKITFAVLLGVIKALGVQTKYFRMKTKLKILCLAKKCAFFNLAIFFL